MNEFIPVPGFEEYLLSRDGVFLNKRNRKPLKLSNEKSGQYPKVKFNHKRYNAHRFLAIAFIPNPENKPFVNHKDGNKFNYALSNLEWTTHDENMKHAQRTGLLVKGTDSHFNILDEIQVKTIWKCVSDGMQQKDVANYFKVHSTTVGLICSGKNWKHLGLQKLYKPQGNPAASKLNAYQVRIIKEALSFGFTQKEIARYFNVHPVTICNINTGSTWSYLQ